ncbi:hypothetical protein LOK49_LG12G01761 [Camellia lanceoleosa]|uniref:Uncharacterized protein n=1 Tax=Camellia lanceoleosa TaxID=1840588 RepID=A0ACC0FNC2_9ERIC|nr:hypothetical protein LOK49_LG12G01761 [Camellia lanceoleosa]
MFFRDLLPRLVKPGDDGNSGSTAVCDTICLQVVDKVQEETKSRADFQQLCCYWNGNAIGMDIVYLYCLQAAIGMDVA